VAVTIEGVGVELVYDVPQRIVHVAAVQRIEFDTGFGHAPPFALGLLALLGGEGREEGVEGLIALIEPMKLAVAAQDQPGTLGRPPCPPGETARARTRLPSSRV
jgi:hypothetical protein